MKCRWVGLVVGVLLNSGCHYSTYIGPFSVEQPVMLGKLQTIGGTSITPGRLRESFDISHYYGHAGWGILGASGAIEFDISDKRDDTEELKKTNFTPDDTIKIDDIYFRSFFIIVPPILVYMQFHSSIGVEGGLYRGEEKNAGSKQ